MRTLKRQAQLACRLSIDPRSRLWIGPRDDPSGQYSAQVQLTAALNFYYLEAFVIAVAVYKAIAFTVTKIADITEAALRLRS